MGQERTRSLMVSWEEDRSGKCDGERQLKSKARKLYMFCYVWLSIPEEYLIDY